mmetsp:Transcript_41085/g.117212  ORF Transcript_41085/g.117212 Transcript_41085/m.117212 type:complete len:241 (+) Transcript_41085:510-1232(+)
MLHVVSPGHVQPTRAAVDCEECGWLVLCHEPPEDPRLRLAERKGAWVGVATRRGVLLPLLVPVAVKVHAGWGRALAEGTVLNIHSRPRVPVQNHLILVVLQGLRGRGPRALGRGEAAEDPEEVEAALWADQLPAVLAEDDEDLVHRVAAHGPDPGHVDRDAGFALGPQRQRPAAPIRNLLGLGREFRRGVVPREPALQNPDLAQANLRCGAPADLGVGRQPAGLRAGAPAELAGCLLCDS